MNFAKCIEIIFNKENIIGQERHYVGPPLCDSTSQKLIATHFCKNHVKHRSFKYKVWLPDINLNYKNGKIVKLSFFILCNNIKHNYFIKEFFQSFESKRDLICFILKYSEGRGIIVGPSAADQENTTRSKGFTCREVNSLGKYHPK